MSTCTLDAAVLDVSTLDVPIVDPLTTGAPTNLQPMRSHSSPRPRSITGSIPARPASATRSWSTWMPRCWRTPNRRGSRCSKTAYAFQLERPSVWPATPAGWSCVVTPTASCWKSAPGHARSRPHSAERCSIETAAVASPAAACGSARVTTSATGRTAGPRSSRISRCCVAAIIVPSTKKGFTSSACLMGSCSSGVPTAHCWRTSRQHPAWQPTRCVSSERGTKQKALGCTLAPGRRGGTGSGWTSAMRSTCCIPSPTRGYRQPRAAARSSQRCDACA
jgi:hypothetical protein